MSTWQTVSKRRSSGKESAHVDSTQRNLAGPSSLQRASPAGSQEPSRPRVSALQDELSRKNVDMAGESSYSWRLRSFLYDRKNSPPWSPLHLTGISVPYDPFPDILLERPRPLQGESENVFSPQDRLTRSSMADSLYRVDRTDLLFGDGHLPDGQWQDKISQDLMGMSTIYPVGARPELLEVSTQEQPRHSTCSHNRPLDVMWVEFNLPLKFLLIDHPHYVTEN